MAMGTEAVVPKTPPEVLVTIPAVERPENVIVPELVIPVAPVKAPAVEILRALDRSEKVSSVELPIVIVLAATPVPILMVSADVSVPILIAPVVPDSSVNASPAVVVISVVAPENIRPVETMFFWYSK